ncbi:MAG: hypothetical protein V3T00_00480 [bacterium]
MADRRQKRRQAPQTCGVCGKPAKSREYSPVWGEIVRTLYHLDGSPAGEGRCKSGGSAN